MKMMMKRWFKKLICRIFGHKRAPITGSGILACFYQDECVRCSKLFEKEYSAVYGIDRSCSAFWKGD